LFCIEDPIIEVCDNRLDLSFAGAIDPKSIKVSLTSKISVESLFHRSIDLSRTRLAYRSLTSATPVHAATSHGKPPIPFWNAFDKLLGYVVEGSIR
jgi:hypothetical protein